MSVDSIGLDEDEVGVAFTRVIEDIAINIPTVMTKVQNNITLLRKFFVLKIVASFLNFL
jgi:hypothetical protein